MLVDFGLLWDFFTVSIERAVCNGATAPRRIPGDFSDDRPATAPTPSSRLEPHRPIIVVAQLRAQWGAPQVSIASVEPVGEQLWHDAQRTEHAVAEMDIAEIRKFARVDQ
jgi:hypothetical protein